MSVRNRFTPEEWSTLLRTPLMAALVMVAASPSGPWGIAREMVAAGRVLARTRREGAGNPIAEAVAEDVSDASKSDPPRTADVGGMTADQVRRHALDMLREAVGILYRKAEDEETEGFKRWLFSISVEVARAAKEGGRLGFGGTLVSDEEVAALRQTAWALGLPATAPGDAGPT
jgi:hypothetical protein